jgi:hypothetical protein
MSSKKQSGGTKAIGLLKFEGNPRRKRPGRHAKRKRPVNQTFFPRQKNI